MIRLVHLAVLALTLAGCPRGPVTPTPDASDASPLLVGEAASPPSVGSPACQIACATLGKFCAEGRDPYCAGDMTKVEGDRLIVATSCPAPGTCFVTCSWCAGATSATDASRRCGTSCSPIVSSVPGDETGHVDAMMDAAAGVMRAVTGSP